MSILTHTRAVGACAGLALSALATVGAGTAAQAAPAQEDAPSPYIIEGHATNSSYIVQLEGTSGRDAFGCTGEALNDEWVLTARHCIDGIDSMTVYYDNDTVNRQNPVAADRVLASPNGGDVALVHLSKKKALNNYANLADSYQPQRGDQGDIFGYGLRAWQVRADWLYTAHVSVLGESTDAYGGSAVHVKGVDGAANHGDSGGPLVVNGQIVGVCSTGDDVDPGGNAQASSNYANLTESRDWIRQTTGA